MTTDRFGRTPAQAKSDQRQILEKAFAAYPSDVYALKVRKDSAERFDIHDLIDHGLLLVPPGIGSHGVVGDSSFLPVYRLSASGLDKLRQPQWLDDHYPRTVHITAFGSSVNVNSPHASATTQANINILVSLREEIERSNLPAEEKSGLLKALGTLSSHPLVIALIAKLFSSG